MTRWAVIIVISGGNTQTEYYASRRSAVKAARQEMDNGIWGANVTLDSTKFLQWVGGWRRDGYGRIYWLPNERYGGTR